MGIKFSSLGKSMTPELITMKLSWPTMYSFGGKTKVARWINV